MSETKPEGWKTVVTILALLFVYPVGVILMFAWMKWPVWVKVIVFLMGLVLFVVVGLTVLAAVLLVAIDPGGQIRRANDTKRKSDVVFIGNAVTRYYLDKREYPVRFEVLVPDYMPAVPIDPDGNAYQLVGSGESMKVCAELEETNEVYCFDVSR